MEAPRTDVPPWPVESAAPRALYLHFPFCTHRCHYCDFSVKQSASPPVDAWLEAVDLELAWWFKHHSWERGRPLDTVFLGGGTPSLLGHDGVQKLSYRLQEWFEINPTRTEWTCEANPASFDEPLAAAWLEAGVNRVSLGVQALDDGVLGWLGRLHDRATAEAAVAQAKTAGFDRVSVDLIFGLPDEMPRNLPEELEGFLSLDVSHVSLYGLTVEPKTPLAEWIRLGRTLAPDEERYADEYRLLSDRLRSAGYEHYEVSNFARPGAQCRHNWYYWNRSPYLAVGPSAHGFLPPFRTWNVFRWTWYERALRAGHGPIDGWEEVGPTERELERIWLGLRTERGLSVEPKLEAAGGRFERWIAEGWIERKEDRWVATVEGWLRMDAMTTEIARDEVQEA